MAGNYFCSASYANSEMLEAKVKVETYGEQDDLNIADIGRVRCHIAPLDILALFIFVSVVITKNFFPRFFFSCYNVERCSGKSEPSCWGRLRRSLCCDSKPTTYRR